MNQQDPEGTVFLDFFLVVCLDFLVVCLDFLVVCLDFFGNDFWISLVMLWILFFVMLWIF